MEIHAALTQIENGHPVFAKDATAECLKHLNRRSREGHIVRCETAGIVWFFDWRQESHESQFDKIMQTVINLANILSQESVFLFTKPIGKCAYFGCLAGRR
jgi:hypothetical protein